VLERVFGLYDGMMNIYIYSARRMNVQTFFVRGGLFPCMIERARSKHEISVERESCHPVRVVLESVYRSAL
jgi:hypothetical protein